MLKYDNEDFEYSHKVMYYIMYISTPVPKHTPIHTTVHHTVYNIITEALASDECTLVAYGIYSSRTGILTEII